MFKERVREMRFFDRDLPPPPLSTLVDIDIVHVMKWTRPSPSVLPTASDQKLDSGKAWKQDEFSTPNVAIYSVNAR